MTVARAELEDGRYALTAKGHASSSEQGCAFISGILYALAGYLTNADAEGYARALEMRLDPGDVSIRAEGGSRVEAAFVMAAIGLLQLEKQRPDLVRTELSKK